jgi:predicted DNA-binding protein
MSESAPMKTARKMIRLSPQEKRRLDRLAAQQNVSLSYAMREGARLYLEDLKAAKRGGHAPTT